MKLYDLVLKLLTDKPELRNSDKLLMWEIWKKQGLINTYDQIKLSDFLYKAHNPESIRRCRQKIQETHTDLGPTKEEVKEIREEKAKAKGTFVFRDIVSGKDLQF